MRTLERVRTGDVYPYLDEYGNAVLQRDYGTKENRAYLEDLKRSMRATGEPEEPPVLVRDGNIYVIMSGNSRVMAMRELGTEEFSAIVIDDDGQSLDEIARAAVETTVRTNTKKRYSSIEESSYVQQFLLFASDQYVADASGVDVATVRAARRGRTRAGTAAEQMSLGHLAAIDEFSGDDAAMQRLMECSEDTWQGVAETERKRIDRERRIRAVREAIEAAGIPIVDERPVGAKFVTYLNKPEDSMPNEPVSVAKCDDYGCSLYHVPDEEELARQSADKLEAARRTEARERSKAFDAERAEYARERRRAWVAQRLANMAPGGLAHLRALALDSIENGLRSSTMAAHTLLEEAGVAPTVGGTLCLAWAYLDVEEDIGCYGIWSYGWGGDQDRHVDLSYAHRLVSLLDALTSDGYVASEDEAQEYEDALAACDGEE